MTLIQCINGGPVDTPKSYEPTRFRKLPPSPDQLAEGVVYDGITGTFLGPPLYKPQEVHTSLAPLPQKVEVSLA